MNIDDTKIEDIVLPDGSLFKAIFDHQHELAKKYGPIERRNGFWTPDHLSHSIDDPIFQNWLKSMFWRATEEVAEALECIQDFEDDDRSLFAWKELWDSRADIRHFYEEMADALHFITEATLYAGVSPASIDAIWIKADRARMTLTGLSEIGEQCLTFIVGMGLTANTLKCKPWKLTHMATDQAKFRKNLIWCWAPFCTMWVSLGFTLEQVYVLYMRKNLVNHWRQETKY